MPESAPEAVTLREAVAEDATAVQALFADHLQALGYHPNPALDADITRDFPQAYRGPGRTFLVGQTTAGETVAMGGLRDGELRRVHVRPAWRGRQLGCRLLLRLLEHHRREGHGDPWAMVDQANQASIAVFQACGFLDRGRRPAATEQRHCAILELPWPPNDTRGLAVISGGSRGLGRHLAETLAAEYRVVFTWRSDATAAAAVTRAIALAGGWALPVRCEVTRPEAAAFLEALTRTVAGPCRILIHNAGHYSLIPLDQVTPDTWRQELDSTVTAAFWLFRAFEASLRSQPSARLIFIGDSAAEQSRSVRHSPGYYVGKHGVLLVARSIAARWQGCGATCNCVSPGVLPNSIDLDQPGMRPNLQFTDLSGVLRFLCSPAAAAVNGAHIVVSGGWNV